MTFTYIVFYHSPCNDGELAKIIWEMNNMNSIFYKWNHAYTEEACDILKNITEPSEIVFLDVCPKLELLPIIHKYHIIDHHKNAINSMKENLDLIKYNITMHCDITKSGCMLTWNYCKPNLDYPLIVRHVGNKDIWNFSDNNTEPYCIGLNDYLDYYNSSGNSRASIIKVLLNNDNLLLHEEIIKSGNKIIEKNKIKALEYFNIIAFNTETLDNITYNIIDIECTDSTMYKYLIDHASSKYNDMDILRILHIKKTDRNIYSMRSLKDNIMVDNIARKYGGNGHPKAAGYTVLF